MAQSSPDRVLQLRKPNGVIKLKVKKKKPSHDHSIRRSVLKPLNGPVQDGRAQALKRKNPFRCSPRKKPNLVKETKTLECRLFKVLNSERGENVENSLSEEGRESGQEEQKSVYAEAEDSNGTEEFETSKQEIKGLETFPLDWSLKNKVRFTSSRSFNWCGTLKTMEEGEGLSTFVRCQTKDLTPDNELEDNSLNLPSSFCSFTKVWMHPSLPWLELFPRKSAEGIVGTKKDNNFPHEVALCLQRDWVCSFRSAFNLLRVGLCPYFYLVANQNTMLFQAAGISQDESVHAVITPTTKGLRDALRKEGINFTMPHLAEEGGKNPDFEPQDEDSEEEELENDSDGEANDRQEWLESMGLDKEQFPLLNPKTVTPHQLSNLRSIDQQPTSTVLVQGADTHALFNFLLNCKSLIASTGPLAGVPPTLLAPVAFDGATLRSLKINQGTLRHQQAKGMTQLYSLEISGPLLPGSLFELCQLLKASQKGDFTATFTPHQPSVALNVSLENSKSEKNSILNGSHLASSISSTQLAHYQDSKGLKRVCLKELNCKDGLFTWVL